jgi:ADP-ribosylglycohydrolase
MIGYGTYNQPPGTWSDDSSLTFCLAEALCEPFNLNTIAKNSVRWFLENYWTARGKVFDIGNATREAIHRLARGVQPELAGASDEQSNGNGSLMRILPLVFYIKDKSVDERFAITKQVSSITHRHIRSVLACFYYLEFARHLLDGKDKFEIYSTLKSEVTSYLSRISVDAAEIGRFDRLLKGDIFELTEDDIQSSGYVLHTLEASIWCLLTTDYYEDAVLRAVNLGQDTDTTAAVTGGLAGLLYSVNGIPEPWIENIARNYDIKELCENMGRYLAGGTKKPS